MFEWFADLDAGDKIGVVGAVIAVVALAIATLAWRAALRQARAAEGALALAHEEASRYSAEWTLERIGFSRRFLLRFKSSESALEFPEVPAEGFCEPVLLAVSGNVQWGEQPRVTISWNRPNGEHRSHVQQLDEPPKTEPFVEYA